MRAAPAIEVEISRFGIWRAVTAAATFLCIATMLAWLMTRSPRPSPGLVAGVLVGLFTAFASGASLWWSAPRRLRWDGQGWHLQRSEATAAGGPRAGRLVVAVDLGVWMLLRFEPAHSTPHRRWPSLRRGFVWLPVQRRGLEAAWHGLRCAVYSPPPSAPADGPGQGV